MAATDPVCHSILNSIKIIDALAVMRQPNCTAMAMYHLKLTTYTIKITP